MDISRYLARIGYTGPMTPDVPTLAALQTAHLYAVPYENLDILRGKPISLQIDDIFEKVVLRRRGGYCFELNELFGGLLRAFGYGVTDLFGRFLKGETGVPMRRHHVLVVRVPGEDQPLVCDVGVGTGSPTWPLYLLKDTPQQQPDGATYRFQEDAFFGWILQEYKRGDWESIYSFTMEPQAPIDFVAASFWCERSPESPFTRQEGIYLRTPNGRLTQEGNAFRCFSPQGVTEEIITDPQEKALRQHQWFGIEPESNSDDSRF